MSLKSGEKTRVFRVGGRCVPETGCSVPRPRSIHVLSSPWIKRSAHVLLSSPWINKLFYCSGGESARIWMPFPVYGIRRMNVLRDVMVYEISRHCSKSWRHKIAVSLNPIRRKQGNLDLLQINNNDHLQNPEKRKQNNQSQEDEGHLKVVNRQRSFSSLHDDPAPRVFFRSGLRALADDAKENGNARQQLSLEKRAFSWAVGLIAMTIKYYAGNRASCIAHWRSERRKLKLRLLFS